MKPDLKRSLTHVRTQKRSIGKHYVRFPPEGIEHISLMKVYSRTGMTDRKVIVTILVSNNKVSNIEFCML
jgi:hypothetical protein